MKPVLIISDFEFDKDGGATTGYSNIATDLGNALMRTGKYVIYGSGISYERQQHNCLFGINAVRLPTLLQQIRTLRKGIGLTDIIVALDIPLQEHLLKGDEELTKAMNFHGVYAVEADPLCMTWAISLSKLKSRFVISDFGTKECEKMGLKAKHFVVNTNQAIWYPRTVDEQKMNLEHLGLQDKYVMFVNGDGNERKNISGVLEALAIAIKTNPKIHLVLLTRKNFQMSWKLDDLAWQLKIVNNLTVIDRGIPQAEVRGLYTAAHSFWNMSKAEGCCLPILEAMSIGVPVVATNCTAMTDHLKDQRGFLLNGDYTWIDPFGNTNRRFVYPQNIANQMLFMAEKQATDPDFFKPYVENARAYIESRDFGQTVSDIEMVLDGTK